MTLDPTFVSPCRIDSQGCLGSFSSHAIVQLLLLNPVSLFYQAEPIYKVVLRVEFSHSATGNLTSVLSTIYTGGPPFHGEVPQWGVPRCHESWHSQSWAGNPILAILLPALGPRNACVFTAFSLGILRACCSLQCDPPHPFSPISSLSLLVRMKRAQFGPHDWLSLSVPPGPSWLLVDSLEPETAYQFSVLAQNRLGTSAFSEVVTVNTLGEVLGWCVSGLFLSRSGLDKGDATDSLRTNIRAQCVPVPYQGFSGMGSFDVPVRIHHFPL